MFLLSLVLVKLVFLVALLQAGGLQGDPLQSLLAAGTAFASVAILGAAKKYTGLADSWLGQKIKPVQPWLVLGLSVLLPAVIHGTPNVPDPQALAVAPTATLLAVGAAEILRRYATPAR